MRRPLIFGGNNPGSAVEISARLRPTSVGLKTPTSLPCAPCTAACHSAPGKMPAATDAGRWPTARIRCRSTIGQDPRVNVVSAL